MDSAEHKIENPSGFGPGGQLRQARLDLRLAPEDVAQMLHLSSRQIVALENDDFGNLPGPTYIRGYLRSYAQLLGLSPGTVVQSYNGLPEAHKPVDLARLAWVPEARRQDRLIKLATPLVAAVILGLAGLWWIDQGRHLSPGSAGLPRPSAARITAVKTRVPASGGSLPTARVAGVPPPPGGAPEGVAPRNVSPPPGSAALGVVPTALTATPGVGTPAPIVVRDTNPLPGARRTQVVLHADQDSWADVRDAGGQQLLYKIVPAGGTVLVEGVAPLMVFLGNPRGVRLQVNGRPFDIGPYIRGSVARFVLGRASPGGH